MMANIEFEYPFFNSTPRPLPAELIIYIIGFVAEGHRLKWNRRCPLIFSTLAAGSLVSRTWNTFCRSHIFDSISIIEPENSLPSLSFLHLEAPHLSKYIRKLHFDWDNHCTTADWLPECLGRMRNLREVHLDCWLPYSTALASPVSRTLLAVSGLRKLALHDWCFTEDVSDLLSMLPATVEQLVLEDIDSFESDTKEKAPLDIGKHLSHLRSLDLLFCSSISELKTFIECPNLARLCVGWDESEPWDLPPWIPANLSELELRAGSDSRIPDFGRAIQPSVVTINLSVYSPTSYYESFTWTKDCINRLPSPHSIQTLTVNIVFDHHLPPGSDSNELYPKLSDYEMFSQFLQQLRVGENLKKITLNVTINFDVTDSIDVSASPADEARESVNLQKGFAELLTANVLDVDFTVKRVLYSDDGITELPETLIHSRIHTSS